MPSERVIMLADCQSFYASVEKAAHPEYHDKPVVVAGDPARRSGIILAACPIAKKKGVKTAETLGQALAGLIRISLGIEDSEDLIEDLEESLK